MTDNNYLKEEKGGLAWGPLIKGELIRRYKRFLADVRLEDDQVVTAHCPNTGSMTGCAEPGWPVYLSPQDNPNRKLKYTWELVQAPDSLVGVNTAVPNRLVKTAAGYGAIEALAGYENIRSEVKVGAHTRLDLVLESPERRTCFVEIKNCTLVEAGIAFFPDAVTTRGQKHLDELARLTGQGARGVIFYLVQRMDGEQFKPADHIDPEYGRMLRQVVEAGVEAVACDVKIDLERIRIHRSVPIVL